MKTPTHLLVDISNSWTKISPSTLQELGKVERIHTHKIDATTVKKLLKKYPGTRLMVSSVVPEKTAVFKGTWKSKGGIHILNHRSSTGIKIQYPNPSKIGADRLANAAAAAHLYPCPSIVIDFGTAVTFDILSSKKAYLGGVIAPGLSAMIDYLHDRTALLPYLKLQEPRNAIGKSTMEAMRVGAVVGYRGLVKEILREVIHELDNGKTTVIATGGYSELIARKLPEIEIVNPLLTLQGLQIIALRESYEN